MAGLGGIAREPRRRTACRRGVVNRLTTLLRPPSEAPLRSAKTSAASASAALMPSTSGSIMLPPPAASAVRQGARTAAYSMPVSRRMRTTSLAWIEKKSPCEFNATSVFTPMTLAHLSNSGPPLLPGLMAALCCTVRALSWGLWAEVMRDTTPVVTVGSSAFGSFRRWMSSGTVSGLPFTASSAAAGKPTVTTLVSFSGSNSAKVRGVPGRSLSTRSTARSKFGL